MAAHPLGRFQPCGSGDCCERPTAACTYCLEGDGPDEFLARFYRLPGAAADAIEGDFVLTKTTTCRWEYEFEAGDYTLPGYCNVLRVNASVAYYPHPGGGGSMVSRLWVAVWDEQPFQPLVMWNWYDIASALTSCLDPAGYYLYARANTRRETGGCAGYLWANQGLHLLPVP